MTPAKRVIKAMQAVEIKKIRVGDYRDGTRSVLYWTLSNLGQQPPNNIVDICAQLSALTGAPLQYFEHIADKVSQATRADEAKRIALFEARKLFRE